MAEEKKKEEKKIIIDEDWKQEAQREKEMLAAQEAAEKKKTQEQSKRRGPLPRGNFAALVSMLTTQSLFALGLLQVEGQEEREPDLALAKYNIDMLETLQAKTKGNLTKEEEKVLENTLSELRMGYVKVAG
jgi:cytochrome c-type biogenesis protein CcmH/NrfG